MSELAVVAAILWMFVAGFWLGCHTSHRACRARWKQRDALRDAVKYVLACWQERAGAAEMAEAIGDLMYAYEASE